MGMEKFKIGDKVRFVKGDGTTYTLKAGKVYSVIRVEPNNIGVKGIDHHVDACFSYRKERFVKVDSAPNMYDTLSELNKRMTK